MKLWKRLAAMLLAGTMAVSAVPASAVIAEAETIETAEIGVDYLASGKTVTIAGQEYSTDITDLHLFPCELTKTDLKNIGKLTKLKKLTLQSCGLKNLSFLKNLTKLETLDLATNSDITSLSPLKNLKKLKVLNLTGTGVKSLSPLKNLTKLESLDLHYIGDNADVSLSPLKNLKKLKHLGLNGTNVQSFSALKNLTKLEELYLSYSPLTSTLPNLKGLKVLHFTIGAEVSDLSFLKKLVNVEELIFECPVDCSDLSALTSMKRLKSLRITVSNTDHFDTSSLKQLSSLETLNFNDFGGSITNDFVEAVRKELPNCSINGYGYGGKS